MKDWVPTGRSAKARLAVAGLEAFGARGYEGVNVVDIAAKAGVTTGSLYHHFEGKLGLYEFVRAEAEQRVADRMAGAAAARDDEGPVAALRAALLVGFDAVVDQRLVRLLAEPSPGSGDLVAELLERILPQPPGTARLLAAAWRAALGSVAEGTLAEHARAALGALDVQTVQTA